ncbi:MAG TPA: FAD-dependent thymidylate synthase [Chromatiaceae bacterium]|nr:FAD-dependent thymidylate synthase [Chromatiaceae bacterium]
MMELNEGSVELLNYTPNGDLLVVNAARCSFDKQHDKFLEGKDDKLVKYLAKHQHLLPFRHPSATLRIVAPIFVLRQLGKHQVGFSWSEVSRRYISDEPEFYHPNGFWRQAADNVKQGSSLEFLDISQAFNADEMLDKFHKDALYLYEFYLKSNICPEQARMVLPQSMMTTTVTTGTLLGWHHLYKLRTEEHTQKETQVYAKAIGEIMSDIFPNSWGALCEHS